MNEEIKKICTFLKQGKTILYPSDTVWGIGCDAENEKAVGYICQIKKREQSKGFIVLISHTGMLNKYVSKHYTKAIDLIENTHFPLTIIYSQAKKLPKNVIAKDGSLALRVVKDPFLIAIINCLGHGIISTSANLCGNLTPKNFKDIDNKILNEVDYVVNWQHNKQSITKPSKIVRIGLDGEIEVLRE